MENKTIKEVETAIFYAYLSDLQGEIILDSLDTSTIKAELDHFCKISIPDMYFNKILERINTDIYRILLIVGRKKYNIGG